MKRRVITCSLALLIVAGITVQCAEPQAAPVTAPKPPEYVTYDAGAAQWLNAPHTVAMSQGVTFGQGDAVLKTDSAVAHLDAHQNLLNAKSLGPMHLYDTQDDLTGAHGYVDFTHHTATLTDNIILIVKPQAGTPESSVRSQFKNPATLTCEEMVYDYRRKTGQIPGPLTVKQVIPQKDGLLRRTLTADSGRYDGKAQTISLLGKVRGEDSDGNLISADTPSPDKPVVFGIQDGAEYVKIDFPLHGRFPVNNQPDDTADQSSPPAAPAHSPAPAPQGKL